MSISQAGSAPDTATEYKSRTSEYYTRAEGGGAKEDFGVFVK